MKDLTPGDWLAMLAVFLVSSFVIYLILTF